MATTQSKYVPPPAAGHVAVPIGDKLYRWGGKGSEQRRNMVDVFNVKTEQWECLTTRGPPPPGIMGCAYTVIGSSLFTFGGRDGYSLHTFGGQVGYCLHNSIHQLDTKTMEWRELIPRNPSDAPQKKRSCGMVSLDDDKLVVFAGYTGPDKRTDELHVFDTKKMTWTPQRTTGTKPPPLSRLTFTKIDATRAVVFGGLDGKNHRNDVYILDMRKWEWALLDVSGGPKPSGRVDHAACCLVGPLTGQEHPLLLVVGGMGAGPTIFNDVWLLDIDRRRWKQVVLPEEILPRRCHTATVFGSAPDCRQLVLWGGEKEIFSGDPIGETTLLNFDLTRGEWKVTSVVKEDQLGKPEERLRKKMGRLWPQTPTRATASQEESMRAEQQAKEAKEREESMRRAKQQAKEAKEREESMRRAEQQAKEAKEREESMRREEEQAKEVRELKEKLRMAEEQAKEREESLRGEEEKQAKEVKERREKLMRAEQQARAAKEHEESMRAEQQAKAAKEREESLRREEEQAKEVSELKEKLRRAEEQAKEAKEREESMRKEEQAKEAKERREKLMRAEEQTRAAKEHEESMRREEEQAKEVRELKEKLRKVEALEQAFELLKKTNAPPQLVPPDPTLPQRIEMKPKIFELKYKLKVIEKVKADWEELAYALYFEHDTVRTIKKDTVDVNEACIDVLSRWLDGEGEREPRTWATLLEALTDMGKTELAKKIGKNLK